jgi:hypothetical protein
MAAPGGEWEDMAWQMLLAARPFPGAFLSWADEFGMHQVPRNRRRLVKETNLSASLMRDWTRVRLDRREAAGSVLARKAAALGSKLEERDRNADATHSHRIGPNAWCWSNDATQVQRTGFL